MSLPLIDCLRIEPVKRASQYTQCLLQRGSVRQVAWIPSQLASAGNPVIIHGETGWTVGAVFQRQDAATTEERQMDHRKQRRASDI